MIHQITATGAWASHVVRGRVRSTYVIDSQLESQNFRLSKGFLSFEKNSFINPFTDKDLSPFFTVTPESVAPCLLEDDVYRIDSVRAQDTKLESPLTLVPGRIREKVICTKGGLLRAPGTWWHLRLHQSCSSCRQERALYMCSRFAFYIFGLYRLSCSYVYFRCKLVYYCGKEW